VGLEAVKNVPENVSVLTLEALTTPKAPEALTVKGEPVLELFTSLSLPDESNCIDQ
jgi:hypothetical protein